jgi:hypothetical protein
MKYNAAVGTGLSWGWVFMSECDDSSVIFCETLRKPLDGKQSGILMKVQVFGECDGVKK